MEQVLSEYIDRPWAQILLQLPHHTPDLIQLARAIIHDISNMKSTITTGTKVSMAKMSFIVPRMSGRLCLRQDRLQVVRDKDEAVVAEMAGGKTLLLCVRVPGKPESMLFLHSKEFVQADSKLVSGGFLAARIPDNKKVQLQVDGEDQSLDEVDDLIDLIEGKLDIECCLAEDNDEAIECTYKVRQSFAWLMDAGVVIVPQPGLFIPKEQISRAESTGATGKRYFTLDIHLKNEDIIELSMLEAALEPRLLDYFDNLVQGSSSRKTQMHLLPDEDDYDSEQDEDYVPEPSSTLRDSSEYDEEDEEWDEAEEFQEGEEQVLRSGSESTEDSTEILEPKESISPQTSKPASSTHSDQNSDDFEFVSIEIVPDPSAEQSKPPSKRGRTSSSTQQRKLAKYFH
jgi:hypothetical protein